MWHDAFQSKFQGRGHFGKAAFDGLLGHVSAISDLPAIIFWRELMEHYPEAKVVLVEREEQKWFRSISVLLEGVLNPIVSILQYPDPTFTGRVFGKAGRPGVRWLFGSTNLTVAKENAIPAYRKHYAEIRAAVPQERLLEYRLGSGWEPLCDFLGKKVPDVPFPHQNETKTLELSIKAVVTKSLRNSAINVAGLVVIAAVTWSVARHFMV